MTCPDCAYWRREAAQQRSAYLAIEATLHTLQDTIDRLQAANEAADAKSYGYLEGRAWPDLGGVTSRTGDVWSVARAAAEHGGAS